MGVSGSGLGTSKRAVLPETDDGAEIAKALSLITGFRVAEGNLLKLQTATKAAKEESDRLLKARTADGFMKEAVRVRAAARKQIADAEEKAESIIKDAQDRIKEALKKTEKERVEFEEERDRARKAVNAKMSSLNKWDEKLREKEAGVRDLTQKALLVTTEAARVKVSCTKKINRLMEILKDG